MMLDATKQDVQRGLLEKELESVGIRLNKRKPNIYFKVSSSIFCLLVRPGTWNQALQFK
jgi:ribosome-interacting GTPase 1